MKRIILSISILLFLNTCFSVGKEFNQSKSQTISLVNFFSPSLQTTGTGAGTSTGTGTGSGTATGTGTGTGTTNGCTTIVCLGTISVYDGSTSSFNENSYSTSGNGDFVLNKNETVRLSVKIGNSGTSDILNLTGTLSTTSNLATIDPTTATQTISKLSKKDFSGNITYSDLSLYYDSGFRITIPVSTPDNSVIPFTISLTDGSGNSYTLNFDLTVKPLNASIVLGTVSVYDGTSYSASGNNDSILNKNETVRLSVKIGNSGTSDILNLSGTLSTTSNLATIDSTTATKTITTLSKKDNSGNITYSDLSLYYNSGFRITIPVTTPDNSVIPFTISLTDGSGNSYTLNFDLTVKPLSASIVLGTVSVYDGASYSASGNNDSILNKNETVRLSVKIGNPGTSDILNLSGTLSTTSNLATIDSTTATKTITTLSKKDNSGNITYSDLSLYYNSGFRITLSNTITDYTQIPFTLTLTDTSNNSWTLPFNMMVYPVGAIVYSTRTIYDTTNGSPLNTDGDGDTSWEKGETIRMNIGLRNTDTVGKAVTALTLTSDSSYVTILSNPTINYGTIAAAGTAYLNTSSVANVANTWKMLLDSTTPSGTKITFTLSGITGGYQDSFVYTVP